MNSKLLDNKNIVVFLNKSIKCSRNNELEDHIIFTFKNGILQQNSVSGNISIDSGEAMNNEIIFTLLDSDSLLVFNKVINEPFYQFNNLNSGKYTMNAYIDLNKNK